MPRKKGATATAGKPAAKPKPAPAAAPVASGSLYSPHPSFGMENAYFENIVKRTGKTLEEWVELVKRYGPETQKERREWLKKEHQLTTNYAWWVAERAEGRGGVEDYDPEALVEALYSGSKVGLRPLHEHLVRLGKALGEDVRVCPCKTIVPFYRRHVFAEIKPATKTRIDFGFALRDTPATGRLVDTGGFAKRDRITHQISLALLADIDDEFHRWLRAAYDMDA
jgi:hypothetical protein